MKKYMKMLILSTVLLHSWLFCAQISTEATLEEFRQGKRTPEALGIVSYCLNNPKQYMEQNETNTYSNPLASHDARVPWEIDNISELQKYLADPDTLGRSKEWNWLVSCVDKTFQPIIEITNDINELVQRLGSTTVVAGRLRITEEQLFGILNENAAYTQIPVIGVAPTLQETIDRYFDNTFTGIKTFQNYYRQLFCEKENLLLMAALIEAEELDGLVGINYPMSPNMEKRIYSANIVTPSLRHVMRYILSHMRLFVEAEETPSDLPTYGTGRRKWDIDRETPGVSMYLEEISVRDITFLNWLSSPLKKIDALTQENEKLKLKLQSLEISPFESVRDAYELAKTYRINTSESTVPELTINEKLVHVMNRYELGNLQETYNALYLEKARLQRIVESTERVEAFEKGYRTPECLEIIHDLSESPEKYMSQASNKIKQYLMGDSREISWVKRQLSSIFQGVFETEQTPVMTTKGHKETAVKKALKKAQQELKELYDLRFRKSQQIVDSQ